MPFNRGASDFSEGSSGANLRRRIFFGGDAIADRIGRVEQRVARGVVMGVWGGGVDRKSWRL